MAEITINDIELSKRVLKVKEFFVKNKLRHYKPFVKVFFQGFDEWERLRLVWQLRHFDEELTSLLEKVQIKLETE